MLAGNVALVGMATALSVTPDLPQRWRDGDEGDRTIKPVTWKDKLLASSAAMAQVRYRMRRTARGKQPAPGVGPAVSALMPGLLVSAPG
ncbi:hypothetical protein ACIP5Y_36715 [Nocardia sp. NPDC088792]|uniref:hypothetical protein n=1 Tax=Nocardia sp. NPDC088792 TaxID=3364332 RepID=UPI0037FA17F6